MVSRRSVRTKSTSLLKKLRNDIRSKPKNSVGVQDINLKRAAAKNQIDAAREYSRTTRSTTTENKQKENRNLEILTRKTRNAADQEDSRIKSCTVLAVKLKYPLAVKTTSVKLNSRSPDKNSDSSKALPRTTVKPPETDLDVQGGSRKSSRLRKPTSKELRSVLISTDTKSDLGKCNGEVPPQKLRNKSVKLQISNEVSIHDKKVKGDDLECVRCGSTPSQFFRRDSEHNTVCCICSLVKPPQELTALLQLLKLDCCLKFLNQKNENTLESNNSRLRKRRISDHTSQTDHKVNATSSDSDVKTLRERNSVKTQKEQRNQNSPEQQKKSIGQFTRPVRQQKGNSSVNLNKPSNAAKSPDLTAVSSTRISTRLIQKTFPRIKPPTKANKQTLSSKKNIHRNLKRKISPQSTRNPTKRRKLAENVEAKKEIAREHICSSCNSTFEMQWKLKLHELTHADRSYPNVVLRHAEVKNASDVTNQNLEGECSEAMDCETNNENTADKNNLNVQVSETAVQQINNATEELQEAKTSSDNDDSQEGGNDLEHSPALKQGNGVKSALGDSEDTVNKENNSDIQNIEITEANICDASTDRKNTEVNQKSDELDSHDVTTNCDNPSDKDNVEVNEESDVPTKCDENPTSNNCTDQSTKTKEDVISKKCELSSSFEDTNSLSTSEDKRDTEQDKIKPSNETSSNKIEVAKGSENAMEINKALGTVSAEDTPLEQSETQNTAKGLSEVEDDKNNEGSDTSVKANEETEPHEFKTNEDEYAGEENEESSEETCGNTTGENTEVHEDDKVDAGSEMDENCSKESNSHKNNIDDCEQKDESLVTEKESNSENTTGECGSEGGNIETEPKDDNHDDQHEADVSENNEIKVNGTATNDDESKSAFVSQNARHPENEVNHAADNNNSQHPTDENMTDIYNQMNMIFEEEPDDENNTAKTETKKRSPDQQLENGDNYFESNDQKKDTENAIKSQE